MPLAAAVIKILEHVYSNLGVDTQKTQGFKNWLKEKNIVVLGKGETGGGPIIERLKKMGTKPNVIDSKTENPEKISVVFKIDEGPQTRVHQVDFVGCESISEYRLRAMLVTRELWILSFMDGAGVYNTDAIEEDKQRIETVYKDQGYIKARVVGVDIREMENDPTRLHVTFHIDEGARYKVRHILPPQDDEIEKGIIDRMIFLEEGDWYTQARLRATLEGLRHVWGSRGYIYTDVAPQIQIDDEAQAIDCSFVVEKGNKVRVNRIFITGNKVTHDKVIRREITLEEGGLAKTPEMEESKRAISYLGYFDRANITWKEHKLADDLIDLELNVKEVKTGHANCYVGFGGQSGTVSTNAKIGVDVGKNNISGRGVDSNFAFQFDGQRLSQFGGDIYSAYLLDASITSRVSGYIKNDEHDQLHHVTQSPVENVKGMVTEFGFRIPKFDRNFQFLFEIGGESNSFSKDKDGNAITAVNQRTSIDTDNYNLVVNRHLRQGKQMWMGLTAVKDLRNHRFNPSEGYRVAVKMKNAFPLGDFNFFKFEVNGSMYIPLIGDDRLVFAAHGKFGLMDSLSSKGIPFRELYLMGGQDSIRGFLTGGAGPAWAANGVAMGAKNSLQLNLELNFPISAEHGMVGRFFYDAGSGWNTPMEDIRDKSLVNRNDFNIRHSVGIGLSVMYPQPIKVDWGYKLDRNKSLKESEWEMHLGMNRAW